MRASVGSDKPVKDLQLSLGRRKERKKCCEQIIYSMKISNDLTKIFTFTVDEKKIHTFGFFVERNVKNEQVQLLLVFRGFILTTMVLSC